MTIRSVIKLESGGENAHIVGIETVSSMVRSEYVVRDVFTTLFELVDWVYVDPQDVEMLFEEELDKVKEA